MDRKDVSVEICRWPNDAPFAYSMTYDEGTVDCLANALPVHEKFGFPGHADVVAGQLGRKREGYGSTLNDFVHMSEAELRFLIGKGWGVGNHSWSHYVYPTQPGLDLWREVVWSKYRLEDALGAPVRIFTIPNDKYNYEPVIDLVKQHYLACAYIEGGPNRDDVDLYKIGNFMVASGKISDAYDWKKELLTDNLAPDFLQGSWLYETTHLVMWDVPQARKCITPEDLSRRFRKLNDVSSGRLWAARPDDVIDYVLLRRSLSAEVVASAETSVRFRIRGTWPIGVIDARLTFRIGGLPATPEPNVTIVSDGSRGAALRQAIHACDRHDDDWLLTVDALPERVIEVKTS